LLVRLEPSAVVPASLSLFVHITLHFLFSPDQGILVTMVVTEVSMRRTAMTPLSFFFPFMTNYEIVCRSSRPSPCVTCGQVDSLRLLTMFAIQIVIHKQQLSTEVSESLAM
jgi:hypothetical protein